ncbi:MAG TPA: inorganic phosphate transporter [Azoarcus taiwanensis]|nr:inorganic phosphate transporter [Azoarcus taiwanensis]
MELQSSMKAPNLGRKKTNGDGSHSRYFSFGIAIAFLIGVSIYAKIMLGAQAGVGFVVVAAAIGAYMAMNIGANDVANNVGPAVGSGALTLGGALVIAGVFEAMGAIIAGGEVVGTIRSGIIDPNLIDSPQTFMWVMMAALLAAALWINMATSVGAPVSTTHSIVGAVAGAGIASSGFAIANWDVIGRIVMSWVVSPVMGGVIAAGLLYLIKRSITYQSDLVGAAKRWVPVLVAFMAAVFAIYMMLKGFSRLWKVGMGQALVVGVVVSAGVFFFIKARLAKREGIDNSKAGVNKLFNIPLICAAALLSFAHGSNDVANAIGPLAAIVEVLRTGGAEIARAAPIPLWVMIIGALGLSIGLWLFGARVIRTVGSEITELDQMRAYCIAMSATVTVLIASELGLPVSTTHVCVGAVMGVGFLREYLKTNYSRMLDEIKDHHPEGDQAAIDEFMRKFAAATIAERGVMVAALKKKKDSAIVADAHLSKGERKSLRKTYRKELVKRTLVIKIAAAWVITVPCAAVMSAFLFYTIKGFMLS